ncbi:MAG: hypothetical protein J7L15_02610 [Clostridiales bacterium]|nr:hypothetical protein [Clostridiales bacterium]
MEKNENTVIKLLDKSIKCEKSEDAIRFSQAALNCSHALQVLEATKKIQKE